MASSLTARTNHIMTPESSARCEKSQFDRLAHLKLRNSDTIMLSGPGCIVKVRNDALIVDYDHGDTKLLKFHRGTHKIKQVFLLSDSGYITIDALNWVKQQGITLFLMRYDGEVIQVLTPKQTRNAKLTYLQYCARESEKRLLIGKEIIRRKTQAQIETLKDTSFLNCAPQALIVLRQGYDEIDSISCINNLLLLEARLANSYFRSFVGYQIRFNRTALKIVPSHWKEISPRTDSLSCHPVARHALNPYHATLNFAYALLEAQVLQGIIVAYLDPTIAFLHSCQNDLNSLVFDLMEPFRAVVDAKVFKLFQGNTFSKEDFIQTETGEVRMSEGLKRYLLASCRVSFIEIDRVCRWVRSVIENEQS